MLEQSNCHSGFKKSLYVFLCSLLGMLLFLILHRLLVIGYFSVTSQNWVDDLAINPVMALAIEYLSLFFAILAGSWYGIWLGLGWYNLVYENNQCPMGLVDHIVKTYWPSQGSQHNLQAKVKKLSESIAEVSNKETVVIPKLKLKKPKAIKKKIIRKKVKTNGKV